MRIPPLLIATFLAPIAAHAPYGQRQYVDLSNFQFRTPRAQERDQIAQQRHEFQNVKLRSVRPLAYEQPAPQYHQLYPPPLQVDTYERQKLNYAPLQVSTYEEPDYRHPQVNTYEEQAPHYPLQVNTYEEGDTNYPRYANTAGQMGTVPYINLPAPPLQVHHTQYEQTAPVYRPPYTYNAPSRVTIEDQPPSTWRKRLRPTNRQ